MRPDRDLDRELRDLGPRVEYPPTPDLAGSVRSRLDAEADRPAQPSRSRPQLWWIAAAALVLLVAVPVLSLAVRGMGGGASSVGGSAAGGGAVESGGREAVEGGREGAGDAAEQEASSSMAAESGASSSAAACASPEPILEARPAQGAPGNEFSIRGRYFVAGFSVCDDTGSGSPAAAQTVPDRDVRVEFLQDGKSWNLGSVEADKGSRIAAKLEVPTDARPGGATVRASYGQGPPEAPYGRVSAEARFSVLD